jgi:hypothetical protein
MGKKEDYERVSEHVVFYFVLYALARYNQLAKNPRSRVLKNPPRVFHEREKDRTSSQERRKIFPNRNFSRKLSFFYLKSAETKFKVL